MSQPPVNLLLLCLRSAHLRSQYATLSLHSDAVMSGLSCFGLSYGQYSITILIHEFVHCRTDSVSALPNWKSVDAKFQCVQHDYRKPKFVIPIQKIDNTGVRFLFGQLRHYVGIDKEAAVSATGCPKMGFHDVTSDLETH